MKLIQGDSMELLTEMNDNSVDLILTDPPYDYSLGTKTFLHMQFTRIAKCVIVFSPPENQWMGGVDQHLFWIKPISTKNTSKNYSRFVELISVYGRNEWNSKGVWARYTNVFHDIVHEKRHPHQKPVSLITRLVLNHTKIGNTVLDPFMGSGTTGVVCKQLKCNFIGIELDKHYFEAAKRRIGEV